MAGIPLSVLSGMLLALSFPHSGHPVFAWLALVPLLVAVSRTVSPLRAFCFGLITGVVHFAGMLYWISQVIVEYGGVSRPVAWFIHLLLIAYLAIFPALFALAIGVLCRRLGPVGLLYAPAVWVTTELGRLYLFTGFPWELLGYSQTPVLPIAQVASLVGVIGVSALVVLVNGALAYAVMAEGARRWRPVVAVTVLMNRKQHVRRLAHLRWRAGFGRHAVACGGHTGKHRAVRQMESLVQGHDLEKLPYADTSGC